MSIKFSNDMAIDLGSASTSIYMEKSQTTLVEPSAVAIARDTGKMLKAGRDAVSLADRNSPEVQVKRPVLEGISENFDLTLSMLESFLKKTGARPSFLKPKVLISYPQSFNSMDKTILAELTMELGSRKVYLMKNSLAAALGAGFSIEGIKGNLIVIIGEKQTEAALVAANGVVTSGSTSIAGAKFNDSIARYVRSEYGLLISENIVEEAKTSLGIALSSESSTLSITGKSAASGLAEKLELKTADIYAALKEDLMGISDLIAGTIAELPPEHKVDVEENGITLTGGSAQLKGLDEFISANANVKVRIAEEPSLCVLRGLKKTLQTEDLLNAICL